MLAWYGLRFSRVFDNGNSLLPCHKGTLSLFKFIRNCLSGQQATVKRNAPRMFPRYSPFYVCPVVCVVERVNRTFPINRQENTIKSYLRGNQSNPGTSSSTFEATNYQNHLVNSAKCTKRGAGKRKTALQLTQFRKWGNYGERVTVWYALCQQTINGMHTDHSTTKARSLFENK